MPFFRKHKFVISDLILIGVIGAVVFYLQQFIVYYRSQLPVFLYTKNYLIKFLSYPGGLIEYLTAYLQQFFIFTWIGVIINTLLLFCISLFTRFLFKSLDVSNKYLLLYLVPALLFALLNGLFEYNFAFSVAVLITLMSVNICLYFKKYNPISRLFLYVLYGILIHALTGGLFLFYIFLIVSIEVVYVKEKKSTVYLPLTVLFYGIVYPYVSYVFLYSISLKASYFYLLPDGSELLIFVILLVFLLFYLLMFFLILVDKKSRKDEKSLAINGNVAWDVIIIIFAIILVFLNGFVINKTDSVRLKTQYFADNRMWDEVLNLSKEEPVIDRLVSFHVNRALYYTGHIADEIFNYPQNYGADGLFIDRYNDNRMLEASSDIYFDLGLINESKHWAYEAFVYYGNKPHLLKRLALIYIINDNYKAALKYLNKLSNTLFYNDWAEKYKVLIGDEVLVERDSLISEKRNFSPQFDFFSDRQNPDRAMKYLLKENNKNRMAFEYLITYYMLSNKFVSLYNNLIAYDVFNYFDKLPLSYQQALLVYMNITGNTIKNDSGYRIDSDVIIDFKGYGSVISRYKGNFNAAQKSLNVNYGNSYWYYLNYVSPVTNKIMIEESKDFQSSYR